MFTEKLDKVISEIRDMLIEKNKKYGDSALNPQGIFSDLGAEALIRSRIDDKLNRIKNNKDGDTEDAELDLIGYLLLLRMSRLEDESITTEYFDKNVMDALIRASLPPEITKNSPLNDLKVDSNLVQIDNEKCIWKYKIPTEQTQDIHVYGQGWLNKYPSEEKIPDWVKKAIEVPKERLNVNDLLNSNQEDENYYPDTTI